LAFIAPIKQLEIDVAVLAEIGDALARLDAERDQRVGNAVGLDVELGEAGLASLEFIDQRVAAVFPGASRTISARFAGACEADMFLPWRLIFVARSLEFDAIRQQKQYAQGELYPRAARSFSFCALIESRALFQSASLQSRS
jgi:hypothetical protein